MNNQRPSFPLYVVSKGRWETRQTAKFLEDMSVPFYIVVEEQERDEYARVIKGGEVLVLDTQFQRDYDTFDDLGDARSKGPGPARNFAWEHAQAAGHEFHWVMDDNIRGFFRYNRNLKVPCTSGAFWCAMENFVTRYQNVLMAGPNYFKFVSRKSARIPPFVLNTRIYSCNLIRCDAPYRWRGRYNEDTDLSLRMLKDGWCTIQFNAFLQDKMNTQSVRGGNNDEFYRVEGDVKMGAKYAKDGTLAKSQMQVRMHPDVSRLVWKFGRWHHQVDYRPFKRNKLIRRRDVSIPTGVDNYGMRLLRSEPKGKLLGRPTPYECGHESPLREKLGHEHVSGGGVPGGHNIIIDGIRKPHIPSMRECNSVDLRYEDVVADVGAYCGTYAIRCARFPVLLVRAYEPSPNSFKVLSLTQLRNMELVNAAVVGNKRASVDFYLSKKLGVTNSLVPSRAKNKITVPAVSYDEAVCDASVVKIDIEGGEYDLGDVVRPSIRALMIDFHPVGKNWVDKAEAIINEIRSAGFEVVIEPNWGNGWTRAGSWTREVKSSGNVCEDLMSGRFCCGCDAPLAEGRGRSLCEECWATWSKRHRERYTQARRRRLRSRLKLLRQGGLGEGN